jgi:four helix bundle protein
MRQVTQRSGKSHPVEAGYTARDSAFVPIQKTLHDCLLDEFYSNPSSSFRGLERSWSVFAEGESCMKDFRQLQVWQKSHQLTLALYRMTASLPREEIYGLTAQIRRSAASIPANIAEGCGRDGDAELAHFCSIARGSASELEYHLLLAHDLEYIHRDVYAPLAQQTVEIKRMLTALIQKLNADR